MKLQRLKASMFAKKDGFDSLEQALAQRHVQGLLY